jgi:ubiquinone/menaquinone biosynthesis C-methylase UbiE
MKNENKPDYGIDGSPVKYVEFIAVEMFLFGTGGYLITFNSLIIKFLASALFLSGLLLGFRIVLFILYEKGGKLAHRDRLLSMVNWKGSENVLDVGTGRGLLLMGAAKKLDTGRVIGIDIWRKEDMQNNTYKNTMRNAELEGVLEKIEVKNEDAQKLSFQSGYFDVVLSNLCLHNIPLKEGRDMACREIARVLKPNGVIIISDILHAKEYAKIFAGEGLSVEVLNPGLFEVTPFWYKTVKAVKNE